jgi:uncharacterized protein YaeQ
LTGAIDLWVEVGLPDEKRILKASGRAEEVLIYSYGSSSSIWWSQIGNRIERAKNVRVCQIAPAISAELARLAQRTMQLQCTIQDGLIWLTDGKDTVQVDLLALKGV